MTRPDALPGCRPLAAATSLAAAAAAAIALAGCTHDQLAASTVATAATTKDIQYQIALDNLARLADEPGALPSQIRIKDGTVQVSDDVGIYDLGVPVGHLGRSFGGPRAERSVSEQWGGRRHHRPAVAQAAAGRLPDGPAASGRARPAVPFPARDRPDVAAGAAAGPEPRRADRLVRPRPPGPRAGRRPVRRHHGDQWVWIHPADVPAFTRFTLAVLFITKLGPGKQGGPSGGLMVTTGGR